MREVIDSWFDLIGGASPAAGIPLILIGLTLMFMGWQFHKTAVPFTYLLLGLGAGQVFAPEGFKAFIAGAVAGLILAVISFFVLRYAVAVLGGLAGVFVVMGYLSLFDRLLIPNMAETAIALFSFAAAGCMAYILHREMTIVVTSLIGSLLLVSGMDPVIHSTLPRMYVTVTAFLADYPGFLVPFLLGGPTLIATLVQLAQANRSSSGQT